MYNDSIKPSKRLMTDRQQKRQGIIGRTFNRIFLSNNQTNNSTNAVIAIGIIAMIFFAL